MPLRRLATITGLGALTAGLACACLPWSVTAPGLTRFVARELAQAYGVAMRAEGPAEITLLPLDVNTLALDGATIQLPVDADDARWSEPARLLAARLGADGTSHPRRVSLSRTIAVGSDPRDGSPQTARDIDLSLSWPLWSAQADLAGSFLWNDAPARFTLGGLRLVDLLDGGATPFSLAANWAAGSLTAEGNGLVRDGGLRLTGRGTFETRSLPETLAWAGGAVALAPVVKAFGLDGSFDLDGRRLMLPNVRVSFGANLLEGAGSVAFDRDRPAIQATLAAESLNLAPLAAETLQMLGLDAAGDLDLRLSTGSARVGPMLAEDVAASVLVRSGSIEASLNRATVATGTLKGRLALNASSGDPMVTEMKAQGAFDGLDLGGLLSDLRQENWMFGRVQGQFMAQGTGATTDRLLNHLDGHAVLGIQGGTLVGLDLADVALSHRVPTQRSGRTAFERATLSLRFVDGVGEIAEGALEGPALSAALRGRVFLPDRRCEAVMDIEARAATADGARATPARFLIGGPLDNLAVRALTNETEPVSRGGAILPPNALRMPAGGPGAQIPTSARAYAP
jgi:AsmA protein